MKARILALVAALLLVTSSVYAQQGGPVNVKATDTSSGASTEVGDNTNHAIRVNIVAGAGSGGTSIQDNTAFTQGTTTETPMGCLYNTSYTNATSGRSTIPQCTIDGNFFVNLNKVGGNALLTGNGVTGTGSLRVTIASDNTAFSVNAVQSGNWTTRIVGNAGSTVDAATGAGTAPTNMLVAGALYNSTEISPTTGQSFALQGDSKGRLRNVIMDGAGNTRAANVTASNELLVNVNNASIPVTQSGTWNIATLTSITNAVITKPIDACSTTNEDFQALVADNTLDTITSTTTCVDSIVVSNKGSASTTVLVQDISGTPLVLVPTTTIAPGGSLVLNGLAGTKMTSGIKIQASNANNLTYFIKGRQ